MITDKAVVELLGWILSNAWMHPILNLKHCFVVSALEQSFKERSTEICRDRVVAESCGRQLVLIADKNYSFGSKFKRDKS